jgi:predicted glycosyltransferase
VGSYDYLPAYEAVLVYGSPDILDAAEEYDLTDYAQRVISCNYVAVESPPAHEMAEPEQPFILVEGGGGADLYPIAKTFLGAVPTLLRETPLQAAILPGPNMPAEQLEDLIRLSEGLPVEVIRGFEDATQLLPKATAVVTMAGYNSMCEALSWEKRALVIPRAGPSAEQRIRSRLFAERHLIYVLDPDEMTPQTMAEGLLSLLADDNMPDRGSIPPLDGAERAAEAMLSSLHVPWK